MEKQKFRNIFFIFYAAVTDVMTKLNDDVYVLFEWEKQWKGGRIKTDEFNELGIFCYKQGIFMLFTRRRESEREIIPNLPN